MSVSEAVSSKPVSDPARVLVVDDVEDNRDLISRRLSRKGYSCEVAPDGPTALRMLEREDFDVIVLDWMMPGMSGIDVLKEIRGRYSKAQLPVLVATAKTGTDAVVQSLAAGANDYVSKPIDFRELVARLESHVLVKREASAARQALIDMRLGIEPGTIIDERYEIGAKIGEGGFAAVYRATQLSTGLQVAFKLLLPHRAARTRADIELARFLREMQIIAEIEHPHVVRLVDSGRIEIVHDDYGEPPQAPAVDRDDATVAERPQSTSGTHPTEAATTDDRVGAVPYIVMEFLDGETLSELLKREAPLPYALAVELLLPVISALGAAHARGIVHRDVKPHNILLVEDHRGRLAPKVLDFGIAKITAPTSDDLTKSDALIGTPEYMAPEQGRGRRDLDGRADQFSVAAIGYNMLTGRKLYEEESFLAMLHSVANAEFPTPSELGVELPPGLEPLLLRALSKKPENRFDTIEGFGLALLRYTSPRVRGRWADLLGASSEISSGALPPEGAITVRIPAPSEQAPSVEPATRPSAAREEPVAPHPSPVVIHPLAETLPTEPGTGLDVGPGAETPTEIAIITPSERDAAGKAAGIEDTFPELGIVRNATADETLDAFADDMPPSSAPAPEAEETDFTRHLPALLVVLSIVALIVAYVLSRS